MERLGKGVMLLLEPCAKGANVQASLGTLEGFKLLGEACSKGSKGSSFPKKLKPRVQKDHASSSARTKCSKGSIPLMRSARPEKVAD